MATQSVEDLTEQMSKLAKTNVAPILEASSMTAKIVLQGGTITVSACDPDSLSAAIKAYNDGEEKVIIRDAQGKEAFSSVANAIIAIYRSE